MTIHTDGQFYMDIASLTTALRVATNLERLEGRETTVSDDAGLIVAYHPQPLPRLS